MISIRRSNERGHAEHDWLESYHTFSFAGYYDARFMGFGNLRVINEDRVAPGQGFGTHSHRDMEIVSYVLEGELAHRDSMGNGTPGGENAGVIRPGDVQRMSAGTGVQHSEFNHSADHPTHFLQIWILPAKSGAAPGYEQKRFDDASKRGRLKLVASPDGHDGSVTIHADASIRAGLVDGEERIELDLDPARLAYVQVVRGGLALNGEWMTAGDGASLRGESRLRLSDGADAEILVFDLAP